MKLRISQHNPIPSAATNTPFNVPVEEDPFIAPLQVPLQAPKDLSPHARALYLALEPERALTPREMIAKAGENPAIKRIVGEDNVAVSASVSADAIQELIEMNMMRKHPYMDGAFLAESVRDDYFVAFGRGAYYARVHSLDGHRDRNKLLATLVGADLITRRDNSGADSTTIFVKHESATDEEEDAATLASIRLIEPRITFMDYGNICIQGGVLSMAAYPANSDPFHEAEVCTDCEKSHLILDYNPPSTPIEDTPRAVRIELLPLRPYLIQMPLEVTTYQSEAGQ